MVEKIIDGYCSNCEEPSYFQYHGAQENPIDDSTMLLFDCVGCGSSKTFGSIAKATKEAIEQGLIEQRFSSDKKECTIIDITKYLRA